MSSCQELINDFLKSTNQRFSIKYSHIHKINLDDATGHYKNLQCVMTDNDLTNYQKTRPNINKKHLPIQFI